MIVSNCLSPSRPCAATIPSPQFLSFGGGENLECTAGSTRPLATHLHDAIDRFVVAERIMVGESQSLGVRGDRVIDRPLGGRVFLGTQPPRAKGLLTDHNSPSPSHRIVLPSGLSTLS